MRTIVILMDSLNRHYIKPYGGWVETPNIDRLAERSVTFDQHYAGSLPCMPARRELWTGRINFLEAPWGSIEPYDDCATTMLRNQTKTYTHLITDHYHYWEQAAHGYHTSFNTWEYFRGQEGDPHIGQVAEPEVPPTRGKGKNRRQEWVNRKYVDLQNDLDYPTPQCFDSAIQFLDRNAQQDNWFLHLEVFDPHEPFISPDKYRDLYNDDWDGGYTYDWPHYDRLDPEHDDPETVQHIRKCYAATLTMADAWLGKLLDKMDQLDMWKDTVIILTTDHGHMLGEHGYWAKNYMFDYQELAHIPLFIYHPDASARRTNALTAAIDIPATLLDLFGAEPTSKMQGRSLTPMLFEGKDQHRETVIYGYFGKDINISDGQYTYTRVPRDGQPVYHYTASPGASALSHDITALKDAQCGHFLPWADGIPVYKIPRNSHPHRDSNGNDLLFDLENDPHQETPLNDPEQAKRMAELMRKTMQGVDAPKEQYDRVGLKPPE
jgi:arylsulfatase A-like enzyme